MTLSNLPDYFVAGGTLRLRTESYVTRPADQELFDHVLAGDFCYVLTPRQMGKSSLMIRTAGRLKKAGHQTSLVDLTSIGSADVPVEAWYQGVLTRLEKDLQLDVDVQAWWAERQALTLSQRFIEFMRNVVLDTVDAPVTIFIDEIDSTLSLDYSDDFFIAIRAMYNERSKDPVFNRLSFVFLGVATPTDLIKDQTQTPFNIGQRIDLQEFSRHDAQVLAAGLEACFPGQGDAILDGIMDWTNGHPYLTQKLCLAASQATVDTWRGANIDELVEVNFFTDEARNDTNLKFVQSSIQSSPQTQQRQMLKLYRQVHTGKMITADNRSPTHNRLMLYGLIRASQNKLLVRNKIYWRVFDEAWIKETTPIDTQTRNAVIISGMALLMVLIVVAIAAYFRGGQDIQADEYVRIFNDEKSNDADRIDALAGLFDLEGQAERGLKLFYELEPEKQEALFLPEEPQAVGPQLVKVVQNIYMTLDRMEGYKDIEILEAMSLALENSGQPNIESQIQQINAWKEGRKWANQQQYEPAISAYSTAIAAIADHHPVIHYDRAMAYVASGPPYYDQALSDFEGIIIWAQMATPTPTPTVPTTATPTDTPTPQLTLTPTPTDSPLSTFTPTSDTFSPDQAVTPADSLLGTSSLLTATATDTPPTAITSGGNADKPEPRFINARQIMATVVDTILGNEDLRNYLAEKSEEFLPLAAITGIDRNAIATGTALAKMESTQTAIAEQTTEAALTQTAMTQRTVEAAVIAGELTARDATSTSVAAIAQATSNAATATPAPPTNTPAPERPALSGKLAFPVDDGAGKYDVHIVSIPDGNELGLIKGARQPYFRSDGAKLLVNGQGGGFGEVIFEASPNGTIEKVMSGSPTDSYPVYSPDGEHIAYSNSQLAIGIDGNYHSYLFVQCGTIPPSQEVDPTCQDIARFGILVPDGQIGEIQGSHPVWATNDLIYFNGCNSWAGGDSCGMFMVGSWANIRSSNGETPRKVADGSSVTPTDTKAGLVAYHSSESGDWEAYVMQLDGSGVVNISNSSNANDGLPTISPDGQWAAFASDRDGGWAVYVAPASGGTATKVFDFPKANPWGTDDRDWTNERMSWWSAGPVPALPTDTVVELPTPTPQPIFFPPPGRIVFTSKQQNADDSNLFVMNGTGEDVTQITFDGGFESNYSSAIDKLAFSKPTNNQIQRLTSSLYLIDPTGENEQAIDDIWDNWEPSFSPDGQRMAFVSSRENRGWEIYTMDTRRSGVNWLTCGDLGEEWLKWGPAWSPTDDRIAFVVQPEGKLEFEGRADIWVINADGTGCKPLTSNEFIDKRPTWSPDGEQIAFIRFDAGKSEIYLMNADGSNQQKLTNSPLDANHPAWSLDGNWIAFSRFDPPRGIYVIDILGNNLIPLTNDQNDNWYPNWLP